MKISILTFAALGRKINLKAADIVPVVETLSAKGVLNRIVCYRNTGFQIPRTYSAIPKILEYVLRLPQKVFGISFPTRRNVYSLFDFWAQWRLDASDIWIFHPGGISPKSVRRARRLGSCTVNLTASVHPDLQASLDREEYTRLGLGAPLGPAIRDFDADFDYVIAVSDFVRDSYLAAAYPPERIFVASLDIDTKRFVPQNGRSKEEPFRVLYMAYTTPLKGLHYLLDAWEQLHLPNAELVLIGGKGDVPDKLWERYQERIQRDLNIKQIESVAQPEREYQRASIFVLPSIVEGFGRVTLEAMACGIPVITTENARGIVENGKTGFIVPVRDASALAEKINYLYEHRDITERMGKEARKTVEQKKSFGEAVYQICQEIMKREYKV